MFVIKSFLNFALTSERKPRLAKELIRFRVIWVWYDEAHRARKPHRSYYFPVRSPQILHITRTAGVFARRFASAINFRALFLGRSVAAQLQWFATAADAISRRRVNRPAFREERIGPPWNPQPFSMACDVVYIGVADREHDINPRPAFPLNASRPPACGQMHVVRCTRASLITTAVGKRKEGGRRGKEVLRERRDEAACRRA